MKTRMILFPLFAIALLSMSCNLFSNLGVKMITPSSTTTSENRDVSGFNAIDFSTFGKVNIIQGDVESLNISGPDNIVPLIKTYVRNGTLVIETDSGLTYGPSASMKDNVLTFTIVAKELTSLDISGLGDVQVEPFTNRSYSLNMSGAGKVVQNQLDTESLDIQLSGLGDVEISGQATTANIDISGAGSVNASDLQIQSADVNISGLGGATVWVTDQLTGNISGAGSVSYYGNPQTSTSSSGLGDFKSMGNK